MCAWLLSGSLYKLTGHIQTKVAMFLRDAVLRYWRNHYPKTSFSFLNSGELIFRNLFITESCYGSRTKNGTEMEFRSDMKIEKYYNVKKFSQWQLDANLSFFLIFYHLRDLQHSKSQLLTNYKVMHFVFYQSLKCVYDCFEATYPFLP